MATTPINLPKIQDLYDNKELVLQENKLQILLNQPPKNEWLKVHPMVKTQYIPIERIEWLLTNVFVKWWVEIRTVQLIANSIVITIRLFYKNPLSDEILCQDGIGASPLQTDKGCGATDFNAIKSSSVQIASPAAESYAVKDAAEKIGKLFGKDLNRADQIAYNLNINDKSVITKESLKELYNNVKNLLTESEQKDAERIIVYNEQNSFEKLYKLLISKQ